MELTVITPVAAHHRHLVWRAAASVEKQTVPVAHLLEDDVDGRGPGVMRNRLLRQVETPYVTFLDADDWLEADFAARTLAAVRPGRYVYTDWYQDERHVKAPECAWWDRTFHLVTSVVEADTARDIGFDESLPALEDTDFFLRLIWRGVCGIRIPSPLMHYRKGDGGRSDTVHANGEVERLREEINRRYGGVTLGCCGGEEGMVDQAPVGEQRPGDVLAVALWGGNRTELGRATGRHYPRMSYPKTAWVDPRDVNISPHLWKLAPPASGNGREEDRSIKLEPAGPLFGIEALEAALVGRGTLRKPTVDDSLPFAPIPNFRKVKRLAGALKLPVFVAPRKAYPSYEDFWRLVNLAGFETRYMDEIDLGDEDETFIFVTPEGIPDCSGAKARTIFWQFEYRGEYANQPNAHTTRETWSSDPEHARRAGAKFVLCGSHRGLNPSLQAADSELYDVTMLAYMTPRRAAIKQRLSGLSWPEDYPGNGQRRHVVLSHSKMLLHVHQHDEPALVPLRLALAAAYRLPVICEEVTDAGPYRGQIVWAQYGNLANMAELYLNGKFEAEWLGESLYKLLCIDNPFERCVMEALEDQVPIAVPDPQLIPSAALHTTTEIAGVMELHYGADYLAYALRSVADFVDKFTILYTPTPNGQYAQTELACPDSRELLRGLAEDALGNKLDWHEGDFEAGIASAVQMNHEAKCVLMLDADEVMDEAILAEIERRLTAGELSEPNYGLPFLHYWRSFRHACNDDQIFPARVFIPKAGVHTYPTGHAVRGGYVHHFGYARSLVDMRYKMALSAHRGQFRPDWWEKFLSYPAVLDDLHPEILNFWYAKPVDLAALPQIMRGHPYYDSEVIK